MKIIICMCVLIINVFTSVSAFAQTRFTLSVGKNDCFSNALQQFKQDHQDVLITTDEHQRTKEAFVSLMNNRDTTFDVYRLDTRTSTFKALIEKQYYVPLESDKTQAFLNLTLPVVHEWFFDHDIPVALPTSMSFPYLFLFNHDIMAELGLTKTELPQNFMELMRFVKEWDDLYADAYPEYHPFYTAGYAYADQNPFIGLMLETYSDYILSNTGMLTYDTALFRELLAAVQPYTLSKSGTAPDSISDFPQQHQCLIYCRRVDEEKLFSIHNRSKLPPFSIKAGVEPVVPFYLECSFINPYSTNIDLAQELLALYATNANDTLKCVLSQELAQPVENPTFQKDYDNWVTLREKAQSCLEEADDDDVRLECEQQISWADALIAKADEYRYDISPEDIAFYWEEMVPHLFARGATAYESENLQIQTDKLVNRYLDGNLDAEQFISELDATVQMVILEGE